MKNIPMRMCVVCREMKPKKELLRIVLNKENKISIDLTGRSEGRGAYICDSEACLAKCVKTKALHKAYGADIGNEVYEKLKEEYAKRKM